MKNIPCDSMGLATQSHLYGEIWGLRDPQISPLASKAFGQTEIGLIRCFHKLDCLHETETRSNKILVASGFWHHTVGETTSFPLTVSGEAEAAGCILTRPSDRTGEPSKGGRGCGTGTASSGCKSDPVAQSPLGSLFLSGGESLAENNDTGIMAVTSTTNTSITTSILGCL